MKYPEGRCESCPLKTGVTYQVWGSAIPGKDPHQRLWQAQTHFDGLYQQGHHPHMGDPGKALGLLALW